MKIAFCLFKYSHFSGLSRDFIKTIYEVQKEGHRVKAFVYEWQGEIPADIDVVLIPNKHMTNSGRDSAYYRAVKRHLQDSDFDVVIGFNKMPGLDYYFAGDICFAAKSEEREFSSIYRLTPRYKHFQQFERNVFSRASETKIFSISNREKSIYQSHYATQEHRFYDLSPSLDKRYKSYLEDKLKHRQSGRQQLGIKDDELMVLFVGSGFRTKGLDRAITALSGMSADLKVKFIVVGDDVIEPYVQLAARLKISDKVQFLGGRNDVPQLMLSADCMLHPAYRETAGNVIVEAMGLGLPILVTDSCGYAEYVNDADAGMVIAADSTAQAITEHLSHMLKSLATMGGQWSQRAINYSSRFYDESLHKKTADVIVNHKKELQPKKPILTRYHLLTYQKLDPQYDTQWVKELMKNPDQFIDHKTIKMLKDDRVTTVALLQLDEFKIVAKRFNTRNRWHIIKRCLRRTRAENCWNFANKLLQYGIQTPQPLGYVENRLGIFRGRSYYFADFCEGVTIYEYLNQHNLDAVQLKKRMDNVIIQMSEFFKVMQLYCLIHGDLKASNLLMHNDKLIVIDLDSMRQHKINYYHQYKVDRARQRFLRNWQDSPQIHDYLANGLLNQGLLKDSIQDQN